MQQRRDEIVAKKQKLAELKRQRELRHKETQNRQSMSGSPSEILQPTPSREHTRREVDNIINGIIGSSRPGSTGPGSPAGGKGSRPTSEISAGQLSGGTGTPPPYMGATPVGEVERGTQTLSIGPLTTIYETPAEPKPEIITYSKGVQTQEQWTPPKVRSFQSDSDDDESPTAVKTPRASKRLSRRERERDEDIRQRLRKEVEEEVRAAQALGTDPVAPVSTSQPNFPARTLSDEELNAVTSSEDFLDFVERSSKVIERALEQEYDILADYALGRGEGLDDEDDAVGAAAGKKGRRIKEVAQFWDERWSKKRMISDLGISPKFPELVLAAYTKNPSAPHEPDGLVQVWNQHMPERPEYVFHAQSDILTAKFSPFHPNLIIGGAYSGQVLLWDTRAKQAPVQKTPLTKGGHTHPVYSLDIVGTQNANNIISCSTDGVVLGWTVDRLSKPEETLELVSPPPSKTDDIAPTCIAFPQSDPTYFLAGTEEGSIYPCHRYDRAGAKAGVDARVKYTGHAAPVMSLDFHPTRGQIDLGDLVLSASVDWSVKLWKVKPPAASSSTAVTGAAAGGVGGAVVVEPLLDFPREDLVYDVRWSPVKPGVFALVDGAGMLEIWDINVDIEVPVAKTAPGDKKGLGRFMARSLNKVAWEKNEGKRIAVGGMDGVVTVFEVGSELGGAEGVRQEEWSGVKKLVGRLEAGLGAGAGTGERGAGGMVNGNGALR
ncbi:WD40 repeat-like protein [Mytilinidion resinicola]|uniref:WD40 repeat-like protein n=1 Tax=Mytilinidion resinicola TaxID=574789 RepID=A0A6A6YJ24_9PEZI|nr:WD40 repeat-like protein [Mytilinidion resinicola]KAF2808548.1 WD40 repeat-like protein [Mytilinidion resinicola]